MRSFIISESTLNNLLVRVQPKDKSLDGRRMYKSLIDKCKSVVIPEGVEVLICEGWTREAKPMKHTIFIRDEDMD